MPDNKKPRTFKLSDRSMTIASEIGAGNKTKGIELSLSAISRLMEASANGDRRAIAALEMCELWETKND